MVSIDPSWRKSYASYGTTNRSFYDELTQLQNCNKNTIKNVLVVGGTGFLGSALLENINADTVHIIRKNKIINTASKKNQTYFQLDINNIEATQIFLKEFSYTHLIYLAWPPSPPHQSMNHVNFSAATIQFLKLFSEFNPNARIIFTGSMHETGITSGIIHNDFANVAPKNLYGISKKFVWEVVTNLEIKNFCWLRLANIYGLYDHQKKILSQLIISNINKKDLVLNNPNAFIDFVHVTDVVRAILKALQIDYCGVINIGSGKGYSLKDIDHFIKNYLTNKNKSKIPFTLQSDYGPVLDISLANKILDYQTTIDLEDGVIEWINHLIEFQQ